MIDDLFSRVLGLVAPPPARKTSAKKSAEPIEMRSIALASGDVDYRLVRRRGRRGIALKIDGTGLCVSTSLTASITEVERIIVQHAGWVEKKLGEWSQRRITPQHWQTGQSIPFMGERLTLMLDIGPLPGRGAAQVNRVGGHLFVASRDGSDAAIEKAVVTWLKKEALPHFAQRAFHYARLHNLTPPRVFLSTANTRWGSCNSRREVRFSWRLIKARPALIDYVVCHELAHLRHMNHSAAFWAEVERMCPDYVALKAELDRSDHLFRAF